MSLIGTKNLTVEINERVEHGSHAARRVILNADLLKTVKLCTGDIVAVANNGSSGPKQVNCDPQDYI